jgi:hypothetical protein
VLPPKRRFSIFDLLRSQLSGTPAGMFLKPGLPSFKTPLYLMD